MRFSQIKKHLRSCFVTEVELDLKLEKCPDKTASMKLKVALRMIKEVDFSNMRCGLNLFSQEKLLK